MGMFIEDYDTLNVLGQLNYRFGAGDAIREMVALQKTFQVFGPDRGLRESFGLLNIGPVAWSQKTRWYTFLNALNKFKSDVQGRSGHDRIVLALKENLESRTSKPAFFVVHAAADDPRVLISVTAPVAFLEQDHIVISIPTKPRKRGPQKTG